MHNKEYSQLFCSRASLVALGRDTTFEYKYVDGPSSGGGTNSRSNVFQKLYVPNTQ